ncbi:MAG: signal peptidase I [Dehalococcoidia bacterium]|nr:signal peptidase I [Dehalococcoidia bacterium]
MYRNNGARRNTQIGVPACLTLLAGHPDGYNSLMDTQEGTPRSRSAAGERRASGDRWWGRTLRALLRVRPICVLSDMLWSMRVEVDGDSMAPALTAGQYVLVSRLAYRVRAPARGDIVVAREPVRPNVLCVKRIAGLPGDEVRQERGRLWLNGRLVDDTDTGGLPENVTASFQWRLGDDEYMVLGDNRRDSRDSRAFGPVKRGHILGKVWFRYWPRQKWGRVG